MFIRTERWWIDVKEPKNLAANQTSLARSLGRGPGHKSPGWHRVKVVSRPTWPLMFPVRSTYHFALETKKLCFLWLKLTGKTTFFFLFISKRAFLPRGLRKIRRYSRGGNVRDDSLTHGQNTILDEYFWESLLRRGLQRFMKLRALYVLIRGAAWNSAINFKSFGSKHFLRL